MKQKPITSWDEVPIIMDLPMAARILALVPETLQKRCRRGTFPAFKAGGEWRVEKEVLIEYIASQRNAPGDVAASAKGHG